MYSGYIPFYNRTFGFGYPSMGYGYPTWGYSGYAGYNSFNGINAIGSAISNQSLINTGSAIGITQTSTPTAIWY